MYTSVLSLLSPLVSHSARVVRSLKMSEMRSSDLETRLSSFDDRMTLEATSVSTPYKARNISCSLIGKDEQQIKDRFQFPDSMNIRIPSYEERTCHSYIDELCFYKADFVSGLCKVEFIQPSNWLYSMPNLFVIQHLVTLYLGGFDVRVVSEIE